MASVANDGVTEHIVLTRLTNEGVLDTSFDSDGHKQIQIGSNAVIEGMFELANGKYILYGDVTEAGVTNGFIAQLDQNANFDVNFATNGIYTTSAISANKIKLHRATKDNAGNIIAVGSLESGSAYAFVIRLTSIGAIDTSFNSVGYITGGAIDEYNSLLIDSSNDVFVAGSRTVSDKDMLVVKYLSNGTVDSSFNSTGELIVDINPAIDDYIEKIKFDTSNNLYLVGNNIDTPQQVSIVRALADGTLDTSFSGDGIASFVLSSTSGNSAVKDAVVANNNDVYVVGFSDVSGTNKSMIGHVRADGTLDLTFDTDGFFESSSCVNAAQLNSAILLNNSSLVVTGQCYIDATFKNNIEISNYQIN
jgi:uncharacterized delta-60 repeat protein